MCALVGCTKKRVTKTKKMIIIKRRTMRKGWSSGLSLRRFIRPYRGRRSRRRAPPPAIPRWMARVGPPAQAAYSEGSRSRLSIELSTKRDLERETGLEPATFSLEGRGT